MTAEGTRSFRIKQNLIDPSKRLITGPAGVSEVSRDLMNLLVHFARFPQEFVSSQQLLLSAGIEAPSGSPELELMIRKLLKLLGEEPEHSQLIVGSADRGYKLCAVTDYGDQSSIATAAAVSAGSDADFNKFVKELSEFTESGDTATTQQEAFTPPVSETGWIESLKRRRVFRAMGAYAVSSWLIMQIVSLLVGAFPAIPPSATGHVTIALVIGFPIVLLLAWLIQLTPRGFIWDFRPDSRTGSVKQKMIHLIDVFVIGVLLVVVAILSVDRYASIKGGGVSIAVLAFTNSNELEEDRYLGVGISDNIRTRLAGVDKLLVAAPPSRELQPGQNLSVKSIGERLNVEYVLYGSVRRANDRVQLDVHLVNVSTGFSQWGKSYSGSLEDMLKVNSDISLYVASELEVILTQELRQSLAGNPTDIPAAYEAYLEARNYLELPRTDYNLGKALLFLNEAVAEDPSFALAYAGRCEAFTAMYLDRADVRSVDLAEENCRIALTLDKNLSQVHVALGNLFVVSGRLDKAEEAFGHALAFDENSLGAIIGFGDVHNARGDFSSAEKQYRLAIDKLPNNWNTYNQLARFLFNRGRYAEAAENYRHVLAFMPNNVNALNNLGAVYFYLGDFEQALRHYQRSLQLEPNEAGYANTGTMFYYLGDFPGAATMYNKAVELSSKDYRVWGNLADAQRFVPNGFEESRASYARAIELAGSQLDVSPGDIQIQSNLAYYLANLGDKEGATALLKQIDLISNLNPETLYTMALTFRLMGDDQRSGQALGEARIQGFPDVVIGATPELNKPELIGIYLKRIFTGSRDHE